jgi:hypothetical protein
MKKVILSLVMVLFLVGASAQEFSISTDLVSRYVWRGAQFSDAPAIQPGLNFSKGGFSAGAWGSYSFDNIAPECDLYASYDFDFGLGLVVNDYFFPKDPLSSSDMSGNYFTYKKLPVIDVTTGDTIGYASPHTYEIGLSYSVGKLSFGAYKYLNNAKDFYVEVGYALNDNLGLIVGAGNQLYTYSSKFNVCNIGLSYSKEVSLTETFKVSPFASFIVNPNREQAMLVVGVSF